MKNTKLTIPALSIRDFVHATEGMDVDELVLKATMFKNELKQLPCDEGEPYFLLAWELDALIHFVKQVLWRLTEFCYPKGLFDEEKIYYYEVINRFYPDEESM